MSVLLQLSSVFLLCLLSIVIMVIKWTAPQMQLARMELTRHSAMSVLCA